MVCHSNLGTPYVDKSPSKSEILTEKVLGGEEIK